MSLFDFGSRTWPGIAKLMEECAEVVQVAAKLVMTQGREEHWGGRNLRAWLEEEIGDALAAINFTIESSGLDRAAIKERQTMKEAMFCRWHAEGLARQ